MVRKASGGETRTKRVPLAGNVLYRNASRDKDQRYINCFQESIKNELSGNSRAYVVKRPGLVVNSTIAVGAGRGIAYFQGAAYVVIGDTLYRNGSNIQTLATSTGPVGFQEFDNTGIRYLFLCDGIDGYQITSAGVVTDVNTTYSTWAATTDYSINEKIIPTVDNGFYYQVIVDGGSSSGTEPVWPTTLTDTIVDGGITWECAGNYLGFPSPHIPTPQFIDGYMMLPKAASQDVYNSDADNIFGWGAANFVTAEIFPDNVRALARQNNQVICFGENSSEFLFDAALASGSPFARNEAAVLQMGIAAPYAIYQNEKFCIFVGQSNSGGRAVWMVDGFQPKKVSTEFIERIIDAEGSSLDNSRGFGVRTKGHLLYLLRLANTTLVYDLEEKAWHEWKSGTATFSGIAIADPGTGESYILDASSGEVYTLDVEEYTDDGSDIIMTIVTSKIDFDNMNRKFMRNFSLVGDEVVAGTIRIRWSDDDYRTWSNWKTLNMSPRAFFSNLGSFRRRAFEIEFTGDSDCRLESLECEIDQGVN